MKMKKFIKNKLSLLAIVGSIMITGLYAFALYTSRTESDMKATAGTVEVQLNQLELTNPKNVNPGDEDPSSPKTYKPVEGDPEYDENNPDKEMVVETTPHKLTFSVSNTGTKSIRTRHTIILSATDTKDTVIDARFLSMFKLDKSELLEKSYILEDKTEVKDIASAGNKKIVGIKYIYLSDSFDGFGKDIKSGGKSEKESATDIIKAESDTLAPTKKYEYAFSLLKEAKNEYQDANLHIDVIVEAMQYRNTEIADWITVSKVNRTFTASNEQGKYAPARDEDKNGNKIDSSLVKPANELPIATPQP